MIKMDDYLDILSKVPNFIFMFCSFHCIARFSTPLCRLEIFCSLRRIKYFPLHLKNISKLLYLSKFLGSDNLFSVYEQIIWFTFVFVKSSFFT